MTENVEHLIIEHLKALRNELREFRARHEQDLTEVKTRLSALESTQGSVVSHIGHLSTSIAGQQIAIDRLSSRIDRIEHRLELA